MSVRRKPTQHAQQRKAGFAATLLSVARSRSPLLYWLCYVVSGVFRIARGWAGWKGVEHLALGPSQPQKIKHELRTISHIRATNRVSAALACDKHTVITVRTARSAEICPLVMRPYGLPTGPQPVASTSQPAAGLSIALHRQREQRRVVCHSSNGKASTHSQEQVMLRHAGTVRWLWSPA